MAQKIVVITGCSSGIGLATAVMLARDKESRFKVFATMRNVGKQAQLEIAAGQCLDKTLFIRQLDVTKENSIEDFMDKINREEGGVDILINNAGIAQIGIVETVKLDQIKTIYNTNVFGLIRMTQEVIPGMKAKKSGHIINVSSCGGLFGVPFFDIYSSSKFAVEGFSESIAPVLRKFNISVSLIEPGPVKTEIASNLTANNMGSMTELTAQASAVDGLTQQLFETCMKNIEKYQQPMEQTGAEIAAIIKDAILSDKPHLHYIIQEIFKKGLPGSKFTDITGDSVVDEIIKQQNWKE